MTLRLIVGTSYGNDSCALVQWLYENGWHDVDLCYYNTGWAASWWPARVERMERWAQSLGFRTHHTMSIGMETLVKQRKGWPRHGMQFCTTVLKIQPSQRLKDELDPERLAICAVGVRRAESERRSGVDEWEVSETDGGRLLWRPLYAHSDDQRDALLKRAGIKPLPHRSRECSPCVNEGRIDLVQTEPLKIDLIERIETELGVSPKTGKARTMFRPARKQGAVGIREVIEWAHSEPGKYTSGSGNMTIDDEPAGTCDDEGYCGI